MLSDSVTDEIRRIRRELSLQFGNDLDLILQDIRQRESSDRRVYVTLSPRLISGQTHEPGGVRADSQQGISQE